MYNVKFHVTDECNIRCKDCHWFSHDVTDGKVIAASDYLNWISKNLTKIKLITITGGEPTLYPHFIELVNNIPIHIQITINTNGTNIDILKNINKRKKVLLYIGNNRKVKPNFFDDIKSIGLKYQIVSYTGYEGKQLKNQVEESKIDEMISLLGKKCFCYPNHEIRFASDGWAYNCEIGITGKVKELRTGVSLWNDVISRGGMSCEIKPNCLSSFTGGENHYKLV